MRSADNTHPCYQCKTRAPLCKVGCKSLAAYEEKQKTDLKRSEGVRKAERDYADYNRERWSAYWKRHKSKK